jgi:hypothetical protein
MGSHDKPMLAYGRDDLVWRRLRSLVPLVALVLLGVTYFLIFEPMVRGANNINDLHSGPLILCGLGVAVLTCVTIMYLREGRRRGMNVVLIGLCAAMVCWMILRWVHRYLGFVWLNSWGSPG